MRSGFLRPVFNELIVSFLASEIFYSIYQEGFLYSYPDLQKSLQRVSSTRRYTGVIIKDKLFTVYDFTINYADFHSIPFNASVEIYPHVALLFHLTSNAKDTLVMRNGDI